MKTSNLLIWLSSLIVVLALIAASLGLFWQDEGNSFSFITLRGDTVLIAGKGLYQYDTTLTAMGFKAGDAVTLILGIPALIFSLLHYRRGSLRCGLLLAGTLAYFLYNYGSMAFGAAYNHLFLIYVALLSIIPALVEGKAPQEVWSYTTVITYAINMGIVAPALIVAGIMLLHRNPLGYLFTATLLVFTVILGINLLTAGTLQMLAGLIDIRQFIGFVASFAILTLYALWFTLAFFREFNKHALPPTTVKTQS